MDVITSILNQISSLLMLVNDAIDWILDGPLVALAWTLVFVGIPAFVVLMAFALWAEHDLKKQTVQVKAMLSNDNE